MKKKNVGKGGKGVKAQSEARKDPLKKEEEKNDVKYEFSPAAPMESGSESIDSTPPNYIYFHKVTKTLIPEHRMEILTAYVDAGDLIISVKDNVNQYREHLYIHGNIPFTTLPPKEYLPIIIKQYVEVNYISELELALKSKFERDSYITRIRNCFYHQCAGYLKNLIDYIDGRTDMYWTEYRGLMKWATDERNEVRSRNY